MLKRKFTRKLSLILSIAVIVTIIPIAAIVSSAAEKANDITSDSFYQFAEDVGEMYEAENTEGEVSAQSIADDTDSDSEFASKRLVVKASGKLSDDTAIATADGYYNMHVFQYETVEDTKAAYERFSQKIGVKYVFPDMPLELNDEEPEEEVSEEAYVSAQSIAENSFVNPYSKYNSWGAEAMGIEEYKDYLLNEVSTDGTYKGLPQVTVAVIDSGVDTDHEIFHGYYDPETNPEGRLLKGKTPLLLKSDNVEDVVLVGHGTHISGTICELTLSNVKILPIRFCTQGLQFLLCMEYAVQQNAAVVNMSLGWYLDDDSGDIIHDFEQSMEDLINDAYDKGTTFVVSAGNDNNDSSKNDFPANIENCITVAAVDENLEKAYFSNYGDVIDVAAPGVDILSAKCGQSTKYTEMSGTSMAAPHVAALAALYKVSNSKMSPKDLERMIKDNAVDIGDEGFDELYGYGFAYAKTKDYVDISFDIKGGEYQDTQTVSINCDDANAKIYYTKDGSIPDAKSTLYNGPITVNKTMILKAVAYKEVKGKICKESIVVGNRYLIANTSPEYSFIVEDDFITGYTGILPKDLIIPSEINGVKIKGIGRNAFNITNEKVESITIEEGIEKIEILAFCELGAEGEITATNKIKKVFLPSSLKEINCTAFGEEREAEYYYNGTKEQFESIVGFSTFVLCENIYDRNNEKIEIKRSLKSIRDILKVYVNTFLSEYNIINSSDNVAQKALSLVKPIINILFEYDYIGLYIIMKLEPLFIKFPILIQFIEAIEKVIENISTIKI